MKRKRAQAEGFEAKIDRLTGNSAKDRVFFQATGRGFLRPEAQSKLQFDLGYHPQGFSISQPTRIRREYDGSNTYEWHCFASTGD